MRLVCLVAALSTRTVMAGSFTSDAEPTAAEIIAQTGRGYAKAPMTATAKPTKTTTRIWERTYDGVPLKNADAISVRLDDGVRWGTTFVRELVPPAPIHRSALVGKKRAIAIAKITATSVTLELDAVHGNVRRPGHTQSNALDFEGVIERFDLVYHVVSAAREHVYVDAYAGTILRVWSPSHSDCFATTGP